jgi:hypothetical protein
LFIGRGAVGGFGNIQGKRTAAGTKAHFFGRQGWWSVFGQGRLYIARVQFFGGACGNGNFKAVGRAVVYGRVVGVLCQLGGVGAVY